jgi:2'-5' RNA ligase
MRAFLAVDVDSTLNYEIQKVQKELKKTAAPLKIVEPENLHFTFKFFGEISPTQTENIIQ